MYPCRVLGLTNGLLWIRIHFFSHSSNVILSFSTYSLSFASCFAFIISCTRILLSLLNKDISDEKVYETLKLVGLDRITDISIPLKTSNYSTGELSLFNIARAIIFDSKILFLDEMNAKIDAISAKKIIEVIDKVSQDKMVLSINHYGDLLANSKILNVEK